jgi:hypothetical protein
VPRSVKFQIYNPIPSATSILQYSKDGYGAARAHGSFSALSLARLIGAMDSDGDLDQLTSLARVWLDYCDKNHERCYEAEDFIPTRVIDVGPPDGSEDPHLYITNFEDKKKPYLTMSYCWGTQIDSNKNLKTTT